MFLLEDGNIILFSDYSIKLIKVLDKNIEILQSIRVGIFNEGILKLDNGIIVNYNRTLGQLTLNLYSYKNGKLVFQKERVEISKEEITIYNMYGINENEIIIAYEYKGWFNHIKNNLAFYDVNKNQIIKNLRLEDSLFSPSFFTNKNKLIICIGSRDKNIKILIIDLINRSIKKIIKFKGDYFFDSIIFLSEKFFLIQNGDGSLSKYYIYNEEKINLEFKGQDKYEGTLYGKYGRNGLIFIGNEGILIYA